MSFAATTQSTRSKLRYPSPHAEIQLQVPGDAVGNRLPPHAKSASRGIPRGNVVVGGGGEGVAVGEGARLAADSVLWMRGRNMARKLRNMERDRFGHSAFLSPKKAPFNSSFSRMHTQLSPKSRIYSREDE
jgi:hypothetical protein